VGSLNYLWDQRGRLWHKLKEHFQTEELRQETLKDHRRMEAIAAHDPAAARKSHARAPATRDPHVLARIRDKAVTVVPQDRPRCRPRK
jgi:hypothetical protein